MGRLAVGWAARQSAGYQPGVRTMLMRRKRETSSLTEKTSVCSSARRVARLERCIQGGGGS